MRHEAAVLHARLIRRFGWSRADQAADAVQDALLRAVETWPFKGVPNRPGAWLYTVAANRMRDALRSGAERRAIPLDEAIERALSSADEPLVVGRGELSDPELEVLFAISHPTLDAKSAIALALQVLCGFSLREIAGALLLTSDAVAQTLSRAKKTLQRVPDVMAIPSGDALRGRLEVALDVVALIFNEGFEPSSGEQTMRADLCAEGVRLADALAAHPITAGPESRALAALLNLLFARLPARLARPGAVTLLPDQDRSRWSQAHLRRGLALLSDSASGDRVSRYHLLAGITATHSVAASLEETDWDAVVASYRLLIALENSPVHRLNFAVALHCAGESVAAEREIEHLASLGQMERYFWFQVTRAEIAARLNNANRSRDALASALAQARTPAQLAFVKQKLAAGEDRNL
jgi:RNA polymerase sigma-70 factor (ECF subfamily)